jgi:hypothetical protein
MALPAREGAEQTDATTPGGAWEKPASPSRSTRSPYGVNRSRSTALWMGTIVTPPPSTARASSATLREFATIVAQRAAFHRSSRAVTGRDPR